MMNDVKACCLEAVIDIGSNSVRIVVYSGGKILLRDLVTTQLIQGITEDKKLGYRSIIRTLDGISALVSKAEKLGKTHFNCFATAAVRNAINGEEFCSEVKKRFGICVDVLSGEQEAAMGLFGALGGADGLVIDVGGGSTEVVAAKGGKVVYAKSVPCGAVVLSEKCARNASDALLSAKKRLEELDFDFLFKLCRSENLKICAIGGTANSLAYIGSGGGEYNREKQNGYVLSQKELEQRLCELFELTAENAANKYNLDLRRAQVLPFGAALIFCVLRAIGSDAVSLVESDNLEGYMHYLNGEKLYEF